jgi:hypothetical protein
MPEWRGLVIETDIVKGTTEYRLASPPPVTIGANSSLTGAAQRQISFLAGTKLPDNFGPYKGLPGKHKDQMKSEAGSISVEWVLKK